MIHNRQKKMTAKFITFACAAFLCIAAFITITAGSRLTEVRAAETTDFSGYTQIKDVEGLKAIASDPSGKYVLMADISLKDTDWYPVNFSGTFNGNGYTIYDLKSTQMNSESNISVDGNAKKYDTYFSGLFGQAKNAVILNLNMKACDINITTEKNCFAGCIAGYTENTEIRNCKVQGTVYVCGKNRMIGAAGITGFGYGTVTGCTVDVTLVVVDGNPSDVKCEQFLGGILATGYSDIENCTVDIKGYASVHGYVHNGGLVGMHFIHTSDKKHAGYVRNNSVNGFITFFENNSDRRAYCAPYVGEVLNGYVSVTGNKNTFTRDERYDYNRTLLPDPCDKPEYKDTVTEPTCTEMGYTTHTCKTCGYTYINNYTFAGHKPGEFIMVRKPSHSENGMLSRYCSVCGKEVEEMAIPKIADASDCILDKSQMKLNYKAAATLSANAADGEKSELKVKWKSSDEKVVSIDDKGNIKATGRGNAVISCTFEDGTVIAESAVTVGYSFWQWVIVILLFGWIWY